MNNLKHGIAHRLLAAFVALVLVFGMIPVTSTPVYAATTEHPNAVTIFVTDAEGNPIEGASVSYTIHSVIQGGTFVEATKMTDANGVVEVLDAAEFAPDDYTISATVTKDGYVSKDVTSAAITSADQNFPVTLVAVTPTIDNVTITETPWTFDGEARALVSVAAQEGDVVTYKLGEGEATETVPTATDAGTYTVTVYVEREGHETLEKTVNVVIAKADIEGVTLEAIEGLTYTGATRALVTLSGVEASDEITWTVNGEPTGSEEIPEGLAVGTYNIVLTVNRGENYNILTIPIAAEIKLAEISLGDLTVKGLNGVYDGEAQDAVAVENAGSEYTLWYQIATVEDGQPVVNEEVWSTDIPTVTNAGSYVVLVKAVQANHSDKNVAVIPAADAVIPYNVYVASQEVKKPAADETNFVFNGNEQTYAIAESDLYTVSGNVQTNAGEHTVTVALKNNVNYVWDDGTTEELSYAFTIAPWEVEKPADDETNFVFNGNEQTYAIAASDLYTVSGNIQTDAGEYTVTVALKDNVNYVWDDGTTEELSYAFTIAPQEVKKPAADETNFVFNGNEQTYAIAESDLYTVSGNVQTNAGEYTVTVALKNNVNYVWDDGTTEELSYTFIIAKADIEGVTLKAIDNLVYSGAEQALVTLSGVEDSDDITWTVNDEATGSEEIPSRLAVGTYNIVLTVNRGENYNILTIPVAAKINLAEISLGDLTVKGLNGVYDGKAQNAVAVENAGSEYTLWYQIATVEDGQPVVDEEAWSTDIPTVTNAGSYVVLVKAVQTNYGDAEVDVTPAADAVIPYNVYIAPQKVEKPAADETNFVFNGNEQTYAIAASDLYTVSGNIQTNAGEYTVTVTLNDKENYIWADGTTEELAYTFAIAPQKVEKPAADETNFVFNGNEQTYAIAESDLYTVSGNVQTNAGEYTVTVTLNDKDNYIWADGTTEDLTFVFTIDKAPQSLTFNNSEYTNGGSENVTVFGTATYNFGTTKNAFEGNEVVYSFGEDTDDGIAQMSEDGSVTVSDAGTVVIVASLEGNDNYYGTTITYTLKVTEGTNDENKLISFEKDSVDHTFGAKLSVQSTIKRHDSDNDPVYSIDKNDIGLTINSETGAIDFDDAKLGEALIKNNGTIDVTVTAEKKEKTRGEGGQVLYEADTASYTITISFMETPEPAYELSGTKGIIDEAETDWYVSDVMVTPADQKEFTISKTFLPSDFDNAVKFDGKDEADCVYLRSVTTGGITAPIPVNISIDKEIVAPTITYSPAIPDDYPDEFYNSDVTVTVELVDAISGVDHFDYSFAVEEGASSTNNGGSGTIAAENIANIDGKYIATFKIPVQFCGSVTVTATDKAGNTAQTVDDKVIVVDNIAPKVSDVTYNALVEPVGEKAYYNGEVAVKFAVTEANFFAEDVIVRVSKNGAEAQPVNPDWADGTGDVHEGTFELQGDGHYIVTIEYTDRSGNFDAEKSSYASQEITIDKTKPVIDFTFDETKQEATIKVTEHNFCAREMKLEVDAKNIKHENVATTDLLAVLQEEANWTNEGDVHTLVLDSTTENKELVDAVYQLTIGCTDLALNPAADVETGKFTVDHTAPDPATISIEYADLHFVDEVNQGQGLPVLDFYKPDVTITFTAYDITSGVKEFYWSYTRENGASETNLSNLSGTVAATLEGDKATATITLPREQAVQLRGNIAVEAVDYCGNGGNESQKVDEQNILVVDTIAPEISVAYNAPANIVDEKAYYTGNVAVEITITEANFFAEDVIVKVSKDGADAVTIAPTWADDSVDVHKGTFEIQGDGHYIVTIEYMDKSDNFDAEKSTYTSHEITIDETAPVIQVAYNNNHAENGKYFDAQRIATITITEHNFDVNRVNFTRNAARGGTNPNVNWTHNGDTHIATIIYAVDGDYTFDATMTDLAGNGGVANYGGSVAPKDFVIDTTYENMITIGGVQNGKAYGYSDNVIPAIDISDINLEDYSISLVGVQKDTTVDLTKKVNALLNEAPENVKGSFDIFEVVQNMDGIYTLTVASKDKAGNQDAEEITFTVNRYGSAYVYDAYLVDLISNGGAYVQRVTDDLVIDEYNADKLVSNSLVIEITCDGKPLENVIYDVTPEINDSVAVGESGWYQYKYTISKDNFTSDGVYKISVSSRDATGNTPENNRYEDLGITFRVDGTLAEISSIVGLEEGIINATEQVVKFTVYDTMGIKSIKVYVDGKLVDEITDFSADANNYSGSFTLTEQSAAQSVRIVVEDLSGNITDTDAEDFSSAYAFNKSVTVSTNIIVRWYANKPLFWGSIGGTVVVAGGLWFFLVAKRKKKEEKTAT